MYIGDTSPAQPSPSSISNVVTEVTENTTGMFSKLSFSMSDNVPSEMQKAIAKQLQRHGG